MKLQAFLTSCIGVAFCILCVTLAIANANNVRDLSGTWTLIPSHSDFAAPMEINTVRIQDAGHHVDIFRDFNGMLLRAQGRWEADGLRAPGQDGNIEHYTLEPDGSMKLVIHRPNAAPVTLFFQRQS